jgi:hypothetical protein
VELFLGDPDVPIFMQPNQVLDMGGFREGSTIPVFGQMVPVRQFLPGEAFAARWGAGRVGSRCARPVLASARPLPEASRAMDFAWAESGTRSEIHAGEAAFRCAINGAPASGYVFAATELVESGVEGNAVWQAKAIAGFVAAAEVEGNAADRLAHMVASFRIDPAWGAQAASTTASVSQIVTRAGDAMSASIANRFAYATRVNDETFRRQVNATRGTHEYYDEESGRTFQLDNRASHYWVGPGHPVPVPTEDSNPPFPGARELQLRR